MTEMVCVKTFRMRMEADFARSMLEAEGIPAFVTADDAGGWRPELLIGAGGARLYVRPEDVERARQAFEAADAADTADPIDLEEA